MAWSRRPRLGRGAAGRCARDLPRSRDRAPRMGARGRRRRRGALRPARRRLGRVLDDPRRALGGGDPQRARHRLRAADRPVRGAPALRPLRARLLRDRLGQRPARGRARTAPPGRRRRTVGQRARAADPWEKPEASRAAARGRRARSPPTSSWSEAAEEPSNLAPPPAEPPSVEELEAAEIPEPPAAARGLPATTSRSPQPASPSRRPELEAPSPTSTSRRPPAGEILAAAPEAEDLKAPAGPGRGAPDRAAAASHQAPPPPPEPEPAARSRSSRRARRRSPSASRSPPCCSS